MKLGDLQGVRRIEDIPFAGILWDADRRPVVFDSIVPGLDLMIWNTPQPGVPDATSAEIREAVLLALAHAIENAGTAGAAVYEFAGYTMFAFATADRDRMIAQMSVKPLLAATGS